MNYEMYIKEGQHLKTLLELNKLTKEELISHEKNLNIFLMDIFFTLYLHGHPPLRKPWTMTPSQTKIPLNLSSLRRVMELPQTSL